jgi:arylsulfatase A-like enzyme
MHSRFARAVVAVACLVAGACHSGGSPGVARLAGQFKPESRVAQAFAASPKQLWRFDAGSAGWSALAGVADLTFKGGVLAGRSVGDLPILHVERPPDADPDLLYAVEVRLKGSAGGNLAVRFDSDEKLDPAQVLQEARDFPWKTRTPLVPGDTLQTYTLRTASPRSAASIRHVLLQPTDVPGARFEVESVRLVFRKEHLASVPSGVSWQGLAGIFKETVVTRSPETARLEVTLPERPWLDLSVGTIEDSPVTFKVAVRAGNSENTLLERTVTRPHSWETVPVDLAPLASQHVKLLFSLASEQPGRLGFWGTAAVRSHAARPPARRTGEPPGGVILIWADTLRADHLDVYGYPRATAPALRRLAHEGLLFRNCLTQATWTKVSTPTLMTSLYPTSHGVREWTDRVPAATVTLAEAYRDAGWATFSFAANSFTGQLTNLHQGFDEVQEYGSLPPDAQDKNARVAMDRLFAWLETHRDGPFFAFLNFLDPHDPYKPYAPYDSLWADPARAEAHEGDTKKVSRLIANPLLKFLGMATREELLQAGLDPTAYVGHEKDWYDGSIRAMDAEIGRLAERLRSLGLEGSTLLVFTSDHGEEFLDHGRMFHGQSAYGELNHAPLILWQPGGVRAGVVEDVVGTIDLMPTLLTLSGVPVPAAAQGRSLVPLVRGSAAADGWEERPTITEKVMSRDEHHDSESCAIVAGGWKLVHNTVRTPRMAEYELYDFAHDPLDQKDVSASHAEVVTKLAAQLAAWRQRAERERVKPDSEAAQGLGSEDLERLRALGYLQ